MREEMTIRRCDYCKAKIDINKGLYLSDGRNADHQAIKIYCEYNYDIDFWLTSEMDFCDIECLIEFIKIGLVK
jgi:hypothetical protein